MHHLLEQDKHNGLRLTSSLAIPRHTQLMGSRRCSTEQKVNLLCGRRRQVLAVVVAKAWEALALVEGAASLELVLAVPEAGVIAGHVEFALELVVYLK
jgi:hypothetical protein